MTKKKKLSEPLLSDLGIDDFRMGTYNTFTYRFNLEPRVYIINV